MMGEAAEDLAVAVGDHDDAQHDPQHKQSKGLNAIESAHESFLLTIRHWEETDYPMSATSALVQDPWYRLWYFGYVYGKSPDTRGLKPPLIELDLVTTTTYRHRLQLLFGYFPEKPQKTQQNAVFHFDLLQRGGEICSVHLNTHESAFQAQKL